MRRFLAFALVALATTGCPPKWTELKKPDGQPYFALAKDYTRTQVRGIGYKWVEGLRAGKYVAQAEDEEGLYFLGEGRCVVILSEENADEYLKTGQSKTGFLPGGLYLPRKGVEKEPKLFYIAGKEPVSSQGAVVNAIIAAGEGEVRSLGYGSEQGFVAGLKIIDK
jgi:hypothetical protein